MLMIFWAENPSRLALRSQNGNIALIADLQAANTSAVQHVHDLADSKIIRAADENAVDWVALAVNDNLAVFRAVYAILYPRQLAVLRPCPGVIPSLGTDVLCGGNLHLVFPSGGTFDGLCGVAFLPFPAHLHPDRRK